MRFAGRGDFSLSLGEPTERSLLRPIQQIDALNKCGRQRGYKTMLVITSPYPSPNAIKLSGWWGHQPRKS